MNLDISSLKKATCLLEVAIKTVENIKESGELREVARDGVIQRFEYTFELSWKMLKRYLEMYMPEKADELSAKDLFRRGFETGLISDSAKWFKFREARNLTTHTYESKTAKLVFDGAKEFLPEAVLLCKNLKEKIGK